MPNQRRKYRRAAIVCLAVVLIATALLAQTRSEQLPTPAPLTIWLFVGTWIGLAISLVTVVLTIRRDRSAMQDRIDKHTKRIVREYHDDDGFKVSRDNRIKEVGRLLLYQEFEFETRMAKLTGSTEATAKKVDALTERFDAVEGIVARAVASGVAQATRDLTHERMQQWVMPDKRERDK